jgi:pimeloyl-ACP methyl ester carboxylesterase
MLHGWGANVELLRPLADRLSGYHVIAPDLPGFGQTPAPPEPWTVFDYAKFVIQLLDALGIEQTYLFGHSFGGRLGLILGADHPDRVIKLALANSAGVRPQSTTSANLRTRTYRAARKTLETVGLKRQSEALRGWYNDCYGAPDFKAAQGVMRETFIHVVNHDLLPVTARVAVPTILFWGDQDTDTPLWQGRLLEQTIPDAGLILYEGASHYSYLDRVTEVARVIDFFFSDGEPTT